MIILTDADGVLENLSQEWVNYLNEKFGTDTKHEELFDWDLTKAFPTLTHEQVYSAERDENLYKRLKPIDGAIEYTKKLMEDGHTLFIVTSTPADAVMPKYDYFFRKYMPFIPWENIIITSNKHLIKGDVLIDDGIHNLQTGDFKKILFSAPYNKFYDAEKNGITRADTWKDVYDIISNMLL